MINQAVTVTANWTPQTFAITVNSSGGSATGFNANPNVAAAGALITISAGTNPGFNFSGWTSPQGVVFANANGTTTTFPMISQAVTVTANWVAASVTYSITMANSGGLANGTANPTSATQGTTISIDANTAGNPGRAFSHWTANPSVGVFNTGNVFTTFTMPNSNVTMTAHWTEAVPIFPPGIGSILSPSLYTIYESQSDILTMNNVAHNLSLYSWSLYLAGRFEGYMDVDEIIPVDGMDHVIHVNLFGNTTANASISASTLYLTFNDFIPQSFTWGSSQLIRTG